MKKRVWVLLTCIVLILCMTAASADVIVVGRGSTPRTAAETAEMTSSVIADVMRDEAVMSSFSDSVTVTTESIPCGYSANIQQQVHTLTHNGQSLRFLKEILGEPDEQGLYPLYIPLHGGGEGPEEGNNDQWIGMFWYYRDSVRNGVYIAVRGITDTWDLHFREATYPLLDALITHMIATEHVDPNRVYLLGFSAGGDGVYQLAPRLADRFAAVSMSSGHPNGVSLINLANCPICLQTGIRDYYSETAERSVRCAEFEKTLTDCRDTYGFGYEHQVWIHVPEGHNFNDWEDSSSTVLTHPEIFAERAEKEDMLSGMRRVAKEYLDNDDVAGLSYYYDADDKDFDGAITKLVTADFGLEASVANTNAVRYVSQFTRDPMPPRLVWDLSTRAASRESTSFYWLQADPAVDAGIIRASFDRESNTYTVEPDETVNGDFAILFPAGMADTGRPVRIVTPKGEYTLQVNPSEEMIRESFLERMDPDMVWVGKILYSDLK